MLVVVVVWCLVFGCELFVDLGLEVVYEDDFDVYGV